MRKIVVSSVAALAATLVLAVAPTAAHAASVPFDPISSTAPIEGYAHNSQITTGYAGSVCFGRLRDGAQAAYSYMDSVFGWPTTGTMYTCRLMDHCGYTTVDPVANPSFYSTCWSNHAQGRAIDLMVGGNAPDPTPLGRGNDLVNWLLQTDTSGNAHARLRRLGVQQIIWNNRCWSSSSSADRAVTTAPAMRVCNEGHYNHIHLDLTIAGADGLTSAYTGAGAPGPSWTSGSMVQDFTGDGKRDLIWRYFDNHDLKLSPGTGGGALSPSSTVIGGFDIADMIMAVPDFTGDGKVDVMWRNRYTKDLMLLSGDGAGGYLNGGNSVSIGGFSIADRIFSGGDFDGDGKTDVIWREASTKDLKLLRGNGAGGFLSPNSVTIGGYGIADMVFSPGDFDGDGKVDVVWREASTKDLKLARGNGAGGFLSGNSVTIGGFGIADMIIGGDLSGDGYADIIWRNATTKELMLLRGNGAGGYLDGGNSSVIGGFGIADMIL